MGNSKKDLDQDFTNNLVGPLSDISARLLTTAEVAKLLVVPVNTLYCWRYKGMGPKAYRVGKHLRFRLEDVLSWVEDQQRR